MKPPVEIDQEVSLNIKALTILLCDHPRETPDAEKMAKSLESLPEKMPVRDAERRHQKPIEERDGKWFVAGYSRKKRERDFSDPSIDINNLLPK